MQGLQSKPAELQSKAERNGYASAATQVGAGAHPAEFDVGDLFGRRAPRKHVRGQATDVKIQKPDDCSDVSTAAGTKTTLSRDAPSSLASVLQATLAKTADASLDGTLSAAGEQRLRASLQSLDAALVEVLASPRSRRK